MKKDNEINIDNLDAKNWAKLQAEILRKKTKQEYLRVDFDPILINQKIWKPILYDTHLTADAHLVPIDNGFRIVMNSWYQKPHREHRWRFTIAHEIGHTLFYDITKKPPKRRNIYGLTKEIEERVCNLFASELLMPGELLPQYYWKFQESEKGNFVSTMLQLATICNVSSETMSIRLINGLALWQGVIFYCQWDSKPSMTFHKSNCENIQEDFAWRIKWSVFSKEYWGNLFIPKSNRTEGIHPKLNWPIIEQLLDSVKSNQIYKKSVEGKEIGSIGNLRKVFNSKTDESIVSIWINNNENQMIEFWPNEKILLNSQKKKLKSAYIAIEISLER